MQQIRNKLDCSYLDDTHHCFLCRRIWQPASSSAYSHQLCQHAVHDTSLPFCVLASLQLICVCLHGVNRQEGGSGRTSTPADCLLCEYAICWVDLIGAVSICRMRRRGKTRWRLSLHLWQTGSTICVLFKPNLTECQRNMRGKGQCHSHKNCCQCCEHIDVVMHIAVMHKCADNILQAHQGSRSTCYTFCNCLLNAHAIHQTASRLSCFLAQSRAKEADQSCDFFLPAMQF